LLWSPESTETVRLATEADFEDERKRLDEARKQLESRLNWREWLWFALALIGMIGIGTIVGMRIAR